jgi:3'-phosphoadenosine 5'-phosphosulfate sulfotransferase
MAEVKVSYVEKDEIVREYLETKGYSVVVSAGSKDRETFTYKCDNEGMPFWVKMAMGSNEVTEKRIKLLKNEIASIISLWQTYPEGETSGFMLPPGPEDIFEENFNGSQLYGYSRFVVQGEILGPALREKKEVFSKWAGKYITMIKAIDALPELGLPRTEEKKDEDFSKVIVETARSSAERLNALDIGNMAGCISKTLKEIEIYTGENKIVTGTAHGDMVPDHVVYLDNGVKPTLINFTKLCQWYPRFYDIAMVHAWVQVVLKDRKGAEELWRLFTENGFEKKDLDQAKVLVNALLIGTLAVYMEGEGRGAPCPVDCDVFMKI